MTCDNFPDFLNRRVRLHSNSILYSPFRHILRQEKVLKLKRPELRNRQAKLEIRLELSRDSIAIRTPYLRLKLAMEKVHYDRLVSF